MNSHLSNAMNQATQDMSFSPHIFAGLQQELGSGAGEDAAPSDHTLQTTKPTEPVKTTVESSISGAIWGDEVSSKWQSW